ncbi:MAG: hypothetical protein ACRCVV_22200 [Shewanella sp.]|uniref:hypothetical protein n=1 Tax=Aeromonas popoffii TaxID=70856 RepID=UPI003F3BF79C
MKREFNKVWFCVAVLALGLLAANIKQAAASEQGARSILAGLNVEWASACGFHKGFATAIELSEKMADSSGNGNMKAEIAKMKATANASLSDCKSVGEFKAEAVKLVEAAK